jgi:hypothetical protein
MPIAGSWPNLGLDKACPTWLLIVINEGNESMLVSISRLSSMDL